jgi:hypothetical protein
MSIDKKFPWSFSGFVIGIIALVVSVVIFYYTESKEKFDLKIIIEDEFNIIELKDELKDLKVFYKDDNIIEQNKEIKIVIYSFLNEGKLITQDYYDKNMDFAIKFDSSNILSTAVIGSNSEYLKKDFLIDKKDSVKKDIVNFKKLIFEPGKKITLKSYLIQNKGIKNTTIQFLGKIAGIDDFQIIRKPEDVSRKKIWNDAFSQFITWFAITYIALIIILYLTIKIKRKKDKKKFYVSWSNFCVKFPEYKDMLKNLEIVKFNSSLNKVSVNLLHGDNLFDLTNFASNKKGVIEYIFGQSNWISFPSDIFDIDNNIVTIKKDKLDFYKKYFEFNNWDL